MAFDLSLVRRVVTAHGKGGSFFEIDDTSLPIIEKAEFPGMRWVDIWAADSVPVDNTLAGDPAATAPLFPSSGGLVFRLMQIDPAPEFLLDTTSPDDHPGMHQTQTLDMVYVLDGEISALLSTGEKILRAGDTFVQRGTRHSWVNRSGKPCTILGALVGAEPIFKK
jgi:hypothetical protein